MLKEFIIRLGQPTPVFYRKLRNLGIAIGAVGTALMTAPVALPAALVTLGGYLVVGGTVLSIISQSGSEQTPAEEPRIGRAGGED